jgi:hypothetical protein
VWTGHHPTWSTRWPHVSISANKEKLKAFLRSCQAEPLLGSFYGQVFESYCHNHFGTGGTFVLRRLAVSGAIAPLLNAQANESQFTFSPPTSTTIVFHVLQELPTPNGIYARPHAKNFPAIDALMATATDLFFFQMTVGEAHPVRHVRLLEVAKRFPSQLALRMVFVVPDWLFNAFPVQNYVDADGKNTLTQLRGPPIAQYVLKVDL